MTLVLIGLVACTRPLANGDDEAGVTTNVGEESTSEASTGEESTDEDTTTSSEETSSTDDSTFIPINDLPPGPQSCDPFMQDCPPGEKCVPYASQGGTWDANKCVPVLGDQPPGEPCTWDGLVEATDNCDATSVCWDVMDVDGELIGECMPFCLGTADEPECPPGSSCLIGSDSTINFCISDCDPLLQDCGAGLGCYWAVSNFSCIFTADELPTGEPCSAINDCAPGNQCADAMTLPSCAAASCCANYCDLDLGDSQCAIVPGTACVPFFAIGEAPPGSEDIGLCIVP